MNGTTRTRFPKNIMKENGEKKICLRNNNFPRISSKELVCVVDVDDVGAAVVTDDAVAVTAAPHVSFLLVPPKHFTLYVSHILSLHHQSILVHRDRRDFVVVFVAEVDVCSLLLLLLMK